MADYPISNVPRRVQYVNSGVGPYAFAFEVLVNTDIAVYRGSTKLTLTADYTVVINLNGTGSVTLTTAGTGNITIVGARAIQRSSDYTTGGDLFASTLNTDLDSQTIFSQQLAEELDRTIKVPVTDASTLNLQLPNSALRANKVFAFDSVGAPLVSTNTLAAIEAATNTINSIAGAPAGNSAGISHIASGVGAVATTVQAKLRESASVKDFGAVGNGVTDDTAAIQAALDSGKNVIYLPQGTYLISQQLTISLGLELFGKAIIKTTSVFSGGSVISLQANAITLKDFTIDASSIPSGTWVRGIGNAPTIAMQNVLISNISVNNATFTGINISANSGVTHQRITIEKCLVQNSGWEGISLTNCLQSKVYASTVISTGWNAIAVWNCSTTNLENNIANKAVPPAIIYDGPGGYGGVEEGGLIYLAPTNKQINVVGNNLYDNRNAGDDGILVGEDGVTEFESIVISGNNVTLAGLFGIDVHSNFTVTGNTVLFAAEVGIFIGRDLGGPLQNAVVSGNQVRNTGTVPGRYGIFFTSNFANPNQMKNIAITGNVVSDDRATKNTGYGLGINLTDSTFTNVLVANNNFANVAIKSINVFGSPNTNNIYFYENVLLGTPLTVTANGFQAYGLQIARIDPGAALTLTNMVGGYVGQKITFVFLRGDTTIDLSSNANFYGNNGVDYTPAAFESATATFFGDAWYWSFSEQ